MAQLFPESCNAIARWSVPALASGVALALGGAMLVERSDWHTLRNLAPPQPVPFSHRHHAGELGIACRFCHATAAHDAAAGVPAPGVCMKCHAEIWRDAEVLGPVRDAARGGEPVRWSRVHDLPDFVYFDHSIHVQHGIECSACHGRVDGTVLLARTAALHMSWCVDCHERAARSDASPRLLDCSVCHR